MLVLVLFLDGGFLHILYIYYRMDKIERKKIVPFQFLGYVPEINNMKFGNTDEFVENVTVFEASLKTGYESEG